MKLEIVNDIGKLSIQKRGIFRESLMHIDH